MNRALLLAMLFLPLGADSARAQGDGKKPADPREELRFDGKPFAYWETLGRNELRAERRVEAIDALAAFGSRGYAKEATAAIVDLLKDYDSDKSAFEFDASKPELLTPDQRVIKEAKWALAKIGPDASPIVLAHLDRKGITAIARELYALDQYGNIRVRFSESAVPILTLALVSKNDDARQSAMRILADNLAGEAAGTKEKQRLKAAFTTAVEKSAKEKEIVAALSQELAGADLRDALSLVKALGRRAKAAVPVLARMEAQGYDVADALREVGATNADRVAACIAEFKDEKSSDRSRAAAKLGELGADARSALPDLAAEIKKPLQQSRNEDAWQTCDDRLVVVNAYIEIAGKKESLPLIVELVEKGQVDKLEMKSATAYFEQELMRVYMKLEGDPKHAVSVLTPSLERATTAAKKHGYGTYQFRGEYRGFGRLLSEIVNALGAQGEHAAPAVPALLGAYEQADNGGKRAILAALGNIGPAAKDALPALSKVLQSEDADLRHAAADAIQAITKK